MVKYCANEIVKTLYINKVLVYMYFNKKITERKLKWKKQK